MEDYDHLRPQWARYLKKERTAPLRQLTKNYSRWQWTETCQIAFDKIKDALSSETVMGYFDLKKETEIIVDASPVGLGAMLIQRDPKAGQGKVIAYASRSLTDTEKRYSQLEKEALAIVFGIERFRTYIYGLQFTLVTDHKPLEYLFNKTCSKPSMRVERWRLRLQPYNFIVVYRKGSLNISDYLSRHPVQETSIRNHDLSEAFVQFIAHSAVPKAMSIEQIKSATAQDSTFQELKEIIAHNSWQLLNNAKRLPPHADLQELQAFSRVKQELCVSSDGDLILRGNRIVIPKALRAKAVDLAHQHHVGIVKTKCLLRSKVWFPGIDKYVEQLIASCIPCLAVGPSVPPPPLHIGEVPEEAWHTLCIEFLGPLPTGQYVLSVIDQKTRYPVVDIISTTSASTVIPRLERIFAAYGLPAIVLTDNGLPFSGYEFSGFLKEYAIQHRRIPPKWLRANGLAENFNKPLMKTICTASLEGKDWRRAIYGFLRNYRCIRHSTTGGAPSELLFHRKPRMKIPHVSSKVDENVIDSLASANDIRNKKKAKDYVDKKKRAQYSTIDVGDYVLLQQDKTGKLSTNFDHRPYRVTHKEGCIVTVEREGRVLKRSTGHW